LRLLLSFVEASLYTTINIYFCSYLFIQTFSESLERIDDMDFHIQFSDKPSSVRGIQEIQSSNSDIGESFTTDDDEGSMDLLRVVFEILDAILSLGSRKRSQVEESLIMQLLIPLQRVAFNLSKEQQCMKRTSSKMQQSAQDIALLIIHRQLGGCSENNGSIENSDCTAKEKFLATLSQIADGGDENRAVNIAYQMHRSIVFLKSMAIKSEVYFNSQYIII